MRYDTKLMRLVFDGGESIRAEEIRDDSTVLDRHTDIVIERDVERRVFGIDSSHGKTWGTYRQTYSSRVYRACDTGTTSIRTAGHRQNMLVIGLGAVEP